MRILRCLHWTSARRLLLYKIVFFARVHLRARLR